MKSIVVSEADLVELLKFLEKQYYEDKVYFCFDKQIGDGYIEVLNDKSRGRGWFVGVRGEPIHVEFPAHRVLDEVEALGALGQDLTQRVTQRALDVASYSYMRAQEVSDILGEDAIIENIKAHEKFSEQLASLILEVLGVEDKPKLRLIKEEKE